MRASRLTAAQLRSLHPEALTGAVLLAPVRLPGGQLAKGTCLSSAHADTLISAAGTSRLEQAVRLAWPDPGDLHEDAASEELAGAVGGAGVEAGPPRQSRVDLLARWNGVLHVRAAALTRLNAVDPLEVFTLFHGQAVTARQVVASVKVAPHLIAGEIVRRGVRIAREEGPLVEVRPYLSLEVAAITEEALSPAALARFELMARLKVESLGSRFLGTTMVGVQEPDRTRDAILDLVRRQGLRVILVGGVSAGDPIATFFAVLEQLGGHLLRRGVPAHPGSMMWLGRLDEAVLLGLPQCGMFTTATAADLILPRLLTGEPVDAGALADLGHGGILGPEMRFRFPAYARDLPAPEGK
jgi:hypothetical protein